jgi:protease-4
MTNFLKNILIAIGFLSVVFTIFLIVMAVSLVRKVGETDLQLSSSKLSSITDESNAVGIVELEGEINTSSDFREKLERFVSNDKIKAIVIRIDSPGGAVGASEEIYRYIIDAREKKPVVCSLGNIAASGGLYSSLGCQKVFTSEGTLTGSIGVILMMPNFRNVLDKVGVHFNVIKTGAYKDAGSPFREFEENDREVLQGIAMEAFEQFVSAISKSRNIPIEKVKEFSDGRIILGARAVELGLADQVGGLKDAAREAITLALGHTPEKDPKLVFPPKKISIPEFLKNMNEQSAFSLVPEKYKSVTIRYQMM